MAAENSIGIGTFAATEEGVVAKLPFGKSIGDFSMLDFVFNKNVEDLR